MKQSEITNLSAAELKEKLSQLKRSYTELKSAHAITPIANPLQIRTARRTIARIATELTKRELQ
jgi:large subunit ribosomal protein L29